jgi:hypothetical protein
MNYDTNQKRKEILYRAMNQNQDIKLIWSTKINKSAISSLDITLFLICQMLYSI